MPTFRDEVRDIVSPHKFGGSRRAAIAYLISRDGSCDEETGSVDYHGWYGRIGRTIISENSQGFVYANRYSSEDEAKRAFQAVAEDYDTWIDIEDEVI